MWGFAKFITDWTITFWVLLGSLASLDKTFDGYFGKLGDFARAYISEVKPFYFIIISINFVSDSVIHGPRWQTPLWTVWCIVLYFLYKNHDDDRWKKRKEKLLEKIEVFDGKLVVVPT